MNSTLVGLVRFTEMIYCFISIQSKLISWYYKMTATLLLIDSLVDSVQMISLFVAIALAMNIGVRQEI